MSLIVDTALGRFRRVTDGIYNWYVWECPACKTWSRLSSAQWNGLVSVLCSCGRYHETHTYGEVLRAALRQDDLPAHAPREV